MRKSSFIRSAIQRRAAIFLAALLTLGCGCWNTPVHAIYHSGSDPSLSSGASIFISGDTGALTSRCMSSYPASAGKSKEITPVWTFFVYLCGTDLESEDASATDDLIEMIDGTKKGGVRFVVETGGAYSWFNDTVKSDVLQRFLVENGKIRQVDKQPRAGMGKEKTLTDFLQWGVKNYASEYMALVLWNHGGGSITGVCFDETDNYDSLRLRELDGALRTVCKESGRTFDLIGFDACLMGSLETAGILAPYARWMIGSQETEPGSGWSYSAIGRCLAKKPDTGAKELGVVICDSFYEDCRADKDERLCTLSLIDLSRLDSLLTSFSSFSHALFEAAADPARCAAMIRSITRVDNFGGNNRSEGYTNMVDLGGIISACKPYAEGASEALDALQNVVVYSVHGQAHKNASGLSVYYPLSVQGSQELAIFCGVSPSPYYIAFVDRLNQACAKAGSADAFDSGFWFDENGNWLWGDTGSGAEIDEAHWDYLNDYMQTGESPLITFSISPHLDSDGDFWFELDDDGYSYASNVCGLVYELSADGKSLIELGETCDLRGGWDTGTFMDDFNGYWLSLPDGQNLALYIVDRTDAFVVYTSPILLNGEKTNLRLYRDIEEGTVTIEGAWNGLNEHGAASRDIIKLKPGDVLVPLYYAVSIESDDEYTSQGAAYTFSDEAVIRYNIMKAGEYYFAFSIDDIYGDYLLTDSVTYSIHDGQIWY